MDNTLEYFIPNSNSRLHIGIIPDGARRWAIKNKQDLKSSYLSSSLHLTDIINYFFSKNVFEISIYVISVQNLKRTAHEVSVIYEVISEKLDILFHLIALKHKTKIVFVGEIVRLPYNLQQKIRNIEEKTSDYRNCKINLCIAYNPISELVDAIQQKPDSDFPSKLKVVTPINFVIRTGGANLLSNFLPLQSGFARLYFLDKLFNETTIEDYKRIYKEYINLELKYGE